MSDDVCDILIEILAILQCFLPWFVDVLRQLFLHYLIVEHVFTKNLLNYVLFHNSYHPFIIN